MKTRNIMMIALLLVLSLGTAARAQGVLINEISTDGTDYVEIANLSATAVNISGWTLQMTTDPTASVTFTFPAATTIAPSEVIVVAENATLPVLPGGVQRFAVGNILWSVNTGGGVALNNASDVGQDTLFIGNGTNLPTGTPLSPFTGSAPAGGGANTQDIFQRTSNTDTDADTDWAMSASGTGSPGALNPGQSGIPAPPTANFIVDLSTTTVGTFVQFTDTSFGSPTSWMWDFDGDTIVDSTAQNPTFAYTATGSYNVSLTVTNGLGSDTLVQNGLIQVIAPPTIPFQDNFTSGSLHPAWSLTSTTNGLIHVGTPPSTSPGSGGDALLFDATTSGTIFLNQATLFIDLSGETDVDLKYWARSASDEADANDGLFISDGTTTVLAVSHTSLTDAWQEIEVDLDAFAAANGLALNSTFQLIFSQQDNFPIPTDGLIIDDVRVQLPPTPDTGQANQPLAYMNITGAVNLNGEPADVGENGPFFLTSANLDITFKGDPSQPWILLAGVLNRNNHVFVPQGSLDIGLGGATSSFGDILVLIDGLSPSSFFDLLAVTNAAGESGIEINVDNLPPGILTTMQALVYRPTAPFVGLTAAFEITIP